MLTRFIWNPETTVKNAARRDGPVALSIWRGGTAGNVMTAADVEPVTSLLELPRRADFVSMHGPLNSETHHMMSVQQFQAMKRTAISINNGRGPTVDEAALVKALQEGWIAGAALDVFEQEPVDTGNPLLKMDNVIVRRTSRPRRRAWRRRRAAGSAARSRPCRRASGRAPPSLRACSRARA
jgi:hypothetical protein